MDMVQCKTTDVRETLKLDIDYRCLCPASYVIVRYLSDGKGHSQRVLITLLPLYWLSLKITWLQPIIIYWIAYFVFGQGCED